MGTKRQKGSGQDRLRLAAVVTLLSMSGAAGAQPSSDVPVELRVADGPGACHAKAFFKPTNESYVEKVLVTPQRVETRTIPPVTKVVETDVVVTPERQIKHGKPAVYEEISETVIVTPATTREIVEPAVYETRKRQIIVTPSQTEWSVRKTKNGRAIQPVKDQKGRPIPGCETAEAARANKDCDVYMPSSDVYEYVQTPPVYGTVEERVLVKPEQRRTEVVPAVTKTVKKTVLKTPSTESIEVVPAVTRRETKTVIVTPGRTETVTVPAVYKEELRVRAVQGEGVWRRVVCQRDINAYLITQIQLALATNGYNPRTFSGAITEDTQDAFQRFQRDNGLPAGPLTYEALKLLGVTMK